METPGDDPVAAEEAEKAAEEAGNIGGPTPAYAGDEADRPRAESGEGESEGFELAEEDLEEGATHAENRYSPRRDAFSGEVEADRATAEYGDADEAIDPEAADREPRD